MRNAADDIWQCAVARHIDGSSVPLLRAIAAVSTSPAYQVLVALRGRVDVPEDDYYCDCPTDAECREALGVSHGRSCDPDGALE